MSSVLREFLQILPKYKQCKTDVKQVRQFLGLAGYYRKFIRHYGLLSRPLTDLLRKNTQFQWTPQLQQCFDTLKQALVTAHVLSLPNFSKEFTVETDASDKGIGVVLMQNHHPIAYLSKALSKRSQTLSTYEKECLAIILAVDKWKPYLQHQPFTIATDQRSLIHLGDQKLSDGLQHKAFIKLLRLNYRLIYKKGWITEQLMHFPGNIILNNSMPFPRANLSGWKSLWRLIGKIHQRSNC